MARKSDFEEIIGSIFAIVVFIMIGGTLITALGDPIGLTGLFSLIFVVGGLLIIIALIIKILNFLGLDTGGISI